MVTLGPHILSILSIPQITHKSTKHCQEHNFSQVATLIILASTCMSRSAASKGSIGGKSPGGRNGSIIMYHPYTWIIYHYIIYHQPLYNPPSSCHLSLIHHNLVIYHPSTLTAIVSSNMDMGQFIGRYPNHQVVDTKLYRNHQMVFAPYPYGSVSKPIVPL